MSLALSSIMQILSNLSFLSTGSLCINVNNYNLLVLPIVLIINSFIIFTFRHFKYIWDSFYFYSIEDIKGLPRRIKKNHLIQLWSLWCTMPTCQVRCIHWCNSGTTLMKVIDCSLGFRQIHRRKYMPGTGNPVEISMHREVTGPIGKFLLMV